MRCCSSPCLPNWQKARRRHDPAAVSAGTSAVILWSCGWAAPRPGESGGTGQRVQRPALRRAQSSMPFCCRCLMAVLASRLWDVEVKPGIHAKAAYTRCRAAAACSVGKAVFGLAGKLCCWSLLLEMAARAPAAGAHCTATRRPFPAGSFCLPGSLCTLTVCT